MEASLVIAITLTIAALATSVYAFMLSRRTERLNKETERLWKSIMDAHVSEPIEKSKGKAWNPPGELYDFEKSVREAEKSTRDIMSLPWVDAP